MKTLIPKSLAPLACAATLCLAPFANLHASDPYTVFLDPDPSVYTGFWDIAAGSSGQVYSVGFIEDGDTFIDKAVIRSLDRGAPGTWEVSTAITDGGRTTLNRWMVAKGIPTSSGGLAWSVVDEFALDTKYGSFATGLAIRPSNHPSVPSEVWIRGTVGSKSGNQVALRRSTNGGAVGSWQTVTTYAGDTRWFRGIGADSLAVGGNGAVYDVGQVAVSVSRKAVENRWTTWRLAPGASSVQVVDQLPVASAALKVGVDSTGRVYVHGGRSGFDGSVLRTSANGTAATWSDYDLAAGASFYGMTIDDEGSVYLAGECYDAELNWWLGCIRKLPAP